ncbi:MAG: NUDIX domain-containing protein [Oscillospiraceae bacterium]|nr:NUDIX domain-containing protein [Oscillospiraceae bacterium]
MHKIFGIKKDVEYTDRKGAYLIPVKENKIAVIKTEKGYFLLGGGIEFGETDEECILRECLEETGCKATVGKFVCSAESYTEHFKIGAFHPIQNYYLGELSEQITEPCEQDHILEWVTYKEIKGKLFADLQNWALDVCMSDLEK